MSFVGIQFLSRDSDMNHFYLETKYLAWIKTFFRFLLI